jgi:hypothetical protein
MRRSSTHRRGARRLGRKFRASERRSAPRPRAPTSKAHRESAHLIGSVLRLSLLRSWTMDHLYWTRSPRPSCCSSAGKSARRNKKRVAGDCPGWVARCRLCPALPSRKTQATIAPARQPVCLNDKASHRWHLQCTGLKQTERKGEAYAKQEWIPGRCCDGYLRERA